MYILIDDRALVANGFMAGFEREGVSLTGFVPGEFCDWVEGAARQDLQAVEAFLIGDCGSRQGLPRFIREHSRAPLIAMNETPSLENTLEWFAAGVDDVVRKPVAIRELLARVEAIRRRVEAAQGHANIGPLRVFFDGRDPELEGNKIEFPRRERRILEYLVTNRGKRVTKSQLFNAVYGLFDDHVQESVIESHVSKLRKKLVACLGEDPIDSKRFLGYCLM
ncbi:MAG: DNA-binding response regulator [Alphaproteobacteria bacterium]|jgi:DNA-binding response OmpR family regulator|nr:DNA-binding response regulator [Alphaproteobacteria bacterium]